MYVRSRVGTSRRGSAWFLVCDSAYPSTITYALLTLPMQGCHMAYFRTKTHSTGELFKALDGILCGHLLYFMTIWYITNVGICYIFLVFGIFIMTNLATLRLHMYECT
jgi:hypothetical protein